LLLKEVAMKWILAALLLNTASGADVGVRVIFGLGDLETAKWDGSATARGAEIRLVEPWRFEDGDAIAGQSWRVATHLWSANIPDCAESSTWRVGP
jgi:hypothetical protein